MAERRRAEKQRGRPQKLGLILKHVLHCGSKCAHASGYVVRKEAEISQHTTTTVRLCHRVGLVAY